MSPGFALALIAGTTSAPSCVRSTVTLRYPPNRPPKTSTPTIGSRSQSARKRVSPAAAASSTNGTNTAAYRDSYVPEVTNTAAVPKASVRPVTASSVRT